MFTGPVQQHGGAHELLVGQVSLLGPAWLQGRLYQVQHYPGAVLSACPEDRIRGELYRMRHPEVLLARLDAYEEIGSQFPEPHEYRRAEVAVMTLEQVSRTAWSYLYNRCTDRLTPLVSGCWFSVP